MLRIDWKAIRAIEGRQDKGFEELCCQLARVERPAKSVFQRNAAPDGGLECFVTLEDGTEHGWQAKYFWTLQDAQSKQLDESVLTALDTHPQLGVLNVCLPFDLADARLPDRKFNRDRWNDLCTKWTKWAAQRSMTVRFELWDSSTLLSLLSDPKHSGRRQFWFDLTSFDQAWFEHQVGLAIKAAGARYTPELHVDLPVAQAFEAIGRTTTFIDNLKSKLRPLRRRKNSPDPETAQPKPSSHLGVEYRELQRCEELLSRVLPPVIDELAKIKVDANGELQFKSLLDRVKECTDCLEVMNRLLSRLEERGIDDKQVGLKPSPLERLRGRRSGVWQTLTDLRSLHEALEEAEYYTRQSPVVLVGDAGTGKTHLLCDIALKRTSEKRPTVLLMGQLFLTRNEPWQQGLQLLDQSNLRIEEFLGALEAAAEASSARALIIVDALNEGEGINVWPQHLSTFLARIEQSEWISLVASVRSTYERQVIPSEIRKRSIKLRHLGFADIEYDALKAFFGYYEIEWQSTPILIPEYRNPLFLKTLCTGLQLRGHKRLPKGIQGVTAIFNEFIEALNEALATQLDYRNEQRLVQKGLNTFVDELVKHEKPWLPLDSTLALLDGILPNRTYSRSLYQGMLANGVFIEEIIPSGEGAQENVVMLAYERFTDHMLIKRILDEHLPRERPEQIFEEGGKLHHLTAHRGGATAGQLEALCTQWPERTGKELHEVVASFAKHFYYVDVFLSSLTWRKPTAVFESTRKALQKIRDTGGTNDILETLIVVSTIPDHALNADYLNSLLSSHIMPERDAFWSTFLHEHSDRTYAINRLIDWAHSVTPDNQVEEQTVHLASTTLAWTLSTPNRFIRDRSTKALVALLTGRLPALVDLLVAFETVDDPYIRERLYASAYGVAMRSARSPDLQRLAQHTYDSLFRADPPPHVLTRDYGRGIVELAIHQGIALDCDAGRIRPPYHSTWPVVPSQEEISKFKPSESKGSHASGDLEWSQSSIWYSVMAGDFARYIIGTNTSITKWRAVKLDWTPPRMRLKVLVRGLTRKQKSVVKLYTTLVDIKCSLSNAHKSRRSESWYLKMAEFVDREEPVMMEKAKEAIDGTTWQALSSLISEIEKELPRGELPMLDLSILQRYIINRVFELGWTIDRFGAFDRYRIRTDGREAHKAERMGKKYQWIAFHEITAYLSDHYVFDDRMNRDDEEIGYEGPWQDYLRDIDPSMLVTKSTGGTGWRGHDTSWWSKDQYDWNRAPTKANWALDTADLPPIAPSLIVTRPSDGKRWCNLNVHLSWEEPVPADREPLDEDRRQIWYLAFAYLIPTRNVAKYMRWAETQDFSGSRMPRPGDHHGLFLGEIEWSPNAQSKKRKSYGYSAWEKPEHGCPVRLATTSIGYGASNNDYDCSIEEEVHLNLPSSVLYEKLGLNWSGIGATYLDASGNTMVYDPTVNESGATACLLDFDVLNNQLASAGLSLCYSIIGEKQTLVPSDRRPYPPGMRISGAATITNGVPNGFLRCWYDPYKASESEKQPLAIVRF